MESRFLLFCVCFFFNSGLKMKYVVTSIAIYNIAFKFLPSTFCSSSFLSSLNRFILVLNLECFSFVSSFYLLHNQCYSVQLFQYFLFCKYVVSHRLHSMHINGRFQFSSLCESNKFCVCFIIQKCLKSKLFLCISFYYIMVGIYSFWLEDRISFLFIT